MKPISKQKPKRYVIKKFVMATTMDEAIRLERKAKPDEVWIDDKQPPEAQEQTPAIGFRYEVADEND